MISTSPRDLLWWVRLYRLGFGLLVVAAIVQQLIENPGRIANFFSFFTIQSNIIGAFVLLLGAAGFAPRTRAWDYVRGGAMMFLMLTGVIYNTILASLTADLHTTVPWVNDVLHKIIPVVMVVDFLIVPLAHRIEFRTALWWTVYPVAYAAYSLIRGPIVDWYPYPFLDPRDSGYVRVTVNMIVIAIGFVAVVWLVVAANNWLQSRQIQQRISTGTS